MNKAVVLLSGGLKSAIALHIAKRYNPEVLAITVDYGQPQCKKIEAAAKVAQHAAVSHQIWKDDTLPLTYKPVPKFGGLQELGHEHNDIYDHDLAGLTILTIGLNRAWQTESRELVIGDRYHTPIPEMGSFHGITTVRPLLGMSRSEIIGQAVELTHGGEENMMDVLALTWSCLEDGQVPCGHCRACIVRAVSFSELEAADPLIAVLKTQGKLYANYPKSGLVARNA